MCKSRKKNKIFHLPLVFLTKGKHTVASRDVVQKDEMGGTTEVPKNFIRQ